MDLTEIILGVDRSGEDSGKGADSPGSLCFTSFPDIEGILEYNDLSSEVIGEYISILQKMGHNSFFLDKTGVFQWCARNFESLALISKEGNTKATLVVNLITRFISEFLEESTDGNVGQDLRISSGRMDMSEVGVELGIFLYGFKVQIGNKSFFVLNMNGFQETSIQLVS